MIDRRSNRLEWISLAYLVFFVLAVLSPSIYGRGYFGFSETTLEELTIFLFGMAGILTFTIYERIMEHHNEKQAKVETNYQKAKAELMESYTYIGSINRKIELLKTLANDTSFGMVDKKIVPRELFQALAANAGAAVGAKSILLRFIEVDQMRTDREFTHFADKPFIFRVPNRDLRAISEQGTSHAFLQTEDGYELLCVPTDRKSSCRAFLLAELAQGTMHEIDTSLLKVFANQAQMLYHQFVLQLNQPKASVTANDETLVEHPY